MPPKVFMPNGFLYYHMLYKHGVYINYLMGNYNDAEKIYNENKSFSLNGLGETIFIIYSTDIQTLWNTFINDYCLKLANTKEEIDKQILDNQQQILKKGKYVMADDKILYHDNLFTTSIPKLKEVLKKISDSEKLKLVYDQYPKKPEKPKVEKPKTPKNKKNETTNEQIDNEQIDNKQIDNEQIDNEQNENEQDDNKYEQIEIKPRTQRKNTKNDDNKVVENENDNKEENTSVKPKSKTTTTGKTNRRTQRQVNNDTFDIPE